MSEGQGPDHPRRPDLYVVARFLDRLLYADETYTKQSLQMAVRLNYDLFSSYLAFLEEKGLVTVQTREKGSDQVRITQEGVQTHRRIVAWIREVIGEEFL